MKSQNQSSRESLSALEAAVVVVVVAAVVLADRRDRPLLVWADLMMSLTLVSGALPLAIPQTEESWTGTEFRVFPWKGSDLFNSIATLGRALSMSTAKLATPIL
jgi:hypothetical protein